MKIVVNPTFKSPIDNPAPEIDTFVYSEGVIITSAGKRVELTPSHTVILGRLMKKMTAGEYHAVALDALASVLWGGADQWPESWKETSKQEVHDLRERMRKGGVKATIDTHRGFGYRLTARLGVKA